MSPWVSLALSVAAVAALALIALRLRRGGAGSRRAGGTLRDFLRHFEEQGLPDDVLLATYHQLQRWMGDARRDFPVRAGDDLERVYGVGPEDLSEALGLLLRACGRRAKPRAAGAPAIRSVEDLVLHLADCPPLLSPAGAEATRAPGRDV